MSISKSVSAIVAGICLTAVAFQAQAADEPTRLRDAAEGLFLIGNAAPTRAFSDLIASDILAQDFNRLTCENEMKFDATEPQEGQFNFRAGDTLVEFAQKYNMKVHGHTFLWHSQTPNWDGIVKMMGAGKDAPYVRLDEFPVKGLVIGLQRSI